jgi:serine/threonine protein kinase/lysophospholipase L1-like esterase
MATVPCPPADQLRQFSLGKLSAAQGEAIGRHVGQCRACLHALEALKIATPLVPTLPRAGQEVLPPRAKNDLSQAPTLPPEPQSNWETVYTGEDVPKQGLEEGAAGSGRAFKFLRPAEAPGEIGRLGSYRILKVLGQGGMGIVFLAEDEHLQRTVALKAMLPEVARRPEARERFLREARAAAKLQHDHIVSIHQVSEDGGVPFIAMPFLKGSSLEEYLSLRAQTSPGPVLNVSQILKIGREIAKGLAAAHECGLIHRDIKPANIWLDATAGGRVKILDFGLAGGSVGEQKLTRSGAIMGTPAYMAPEQAQGKTVDHRADLFSLGVLLYRLCTGKLPFLREDLVGTLLAIATHQPPPPLTMAPNTPFELSELVMKLLVKNPAERVASGREVVRTILAIEGRLSAQTAYSCPAESLEPTQTPARGVPPVAPSAPRRGTGRRRRLWITAGLAVALIAGSVVIAGIFSGRADEGGKSDEKALATDSNEGGKSEKKTLATDIKKVIPPPNPGEDKKTAPRDPGGADATRIRRQRRRHLAGIRSANGGDYRDKLRALGATLVLLEFKRGPNGLPEQNKQGGPVLLYRKVIRDLDKQPAQPRVEEKIKIEGLPWVDSHPVSIKALATSLGIEAPGQIVYVFPRALEAELRRLEKAAFKGREEDIHESYFRVVEDAKGPYKGKNKAYRIVCDRVAPKSPADVPAPRLGGDGKPDAAWLKAHQGFRSLAAKGGIDVLFLGDGNTDAWLTGAGKAVWAKRFVPLKAEAFGFANDRTENVQWRIRNGELDGIAPKVVVLMIGINNILFDGLERSGGEEVAAGITAIVKTIRAKSPGSRVLLMAIFPYGPQGGTALRKKIAAVNEIIARLDDGKAVRYLDIGPKLLQANGFLPANIIQGVNIQRRGYEIWAAAIAPLLQEMLRG